MKKCLYVFIILLIYSLNASSQTTYKNLIRSADSLYKVNNYKQSLEIYKKAFEIEENSKIDFYNAACSAALANDIKSSFYLLGKAIEAGWSNLLHLENDKDLVRLKSSAHWSKFLLRIQKVVDDREAQYEQPLRKELLQILEDDQKVRNKYSKALKDKGSDDSTADSLLVVMGTSDELNLKKVCEILDKRGWPSRKNVGDEGVQALFLVLQHSNIEIQEKYLPLMKEAIGKGDLRPAAYAMLQDRILLRKGNKQIYGSQIGQNNKSGVHYVLPLEDPENVDKRRLEVGLEPMINYVSKWGINWSLEEYEKGLQQKEKPKLITRPPFKIY